MKKFVIILAVVCLLLGAALGYFFSRNAATAPEITAAPVQAEENTAEEAAASETETLDYDALYAAYAPDDVVATVNGKDVKWSELYYWLCNVASQAQSYIDTMTMSGAETSWESPISATEEQTIAAYTVEAATESAKQLDTIEALMAENGVELTDADREQLAQLLQTDIEGLAGEGADEAAFEAVLAERHMTREMYDRINSVNLLYQDGYDKLYGENGSKVSEKDAIAYLTENEYLCAGHILFMTVDANTGEALDDETVALKKAQAEDVAKQLRAIADPEERLKRFAELKEQFCEDSGKTAYPDGYLFTPGTMVQEFEDTAKSLGEYEVSDPVLTSYGYHVLMGLPLSADMTINYSQLGTPLTARAMYANAQYSSLVSSAIENAEFSFTSLMDGFDLLEYVKK